MNGAAQTRFAEWIGTEMAPFLRGRGFNGSGTTFSRRVERNWLLVHIEKSRHSDGETVLFRISVGVASAAILAANGDDPDRRPSGYALNRMFGPQALYDPPGGLGFYRFESNDAGLAERLRVMVGSAIDEALENADDVAILAARLSVIGPLEDESPHGIGELVALATSTGDDDLLARIAAAQDRPRVVDPRLDAERRFALEVGLDIAEGLGGSVSLGSMNVTRANIAHVADWQPPDFFLPTPPIVGRQGRRRLDGLLADLESIRVPKRGRAAWVLGGWESSPEILDALRVAVADDDRYVVQASIQSLGLLEDPDPRTWELAIDLLERETADRSRGALLTAYGTVELARLDLARRAARTRSALERLVDIDLSERRAYRLLLDRLASPQA